MNLPKLTLRSGRQPLSPECEIVSSNIPIFIICDAEDERIRHAPSKGITLLKPQTLGFSLSSFQTLIILQIRKEKKNEKCKSVSLTEVCPRNPPRMRNVDLQEAGPSSAPPPGLCLKVRERYLVLKSS